MTLDFETLIRNAKQTEPPVNKDIEQLRQRVDYAKLDEFDSKFIMSIENRLNKGYELSEKQSKHLGKILVKYSK